VKVFGGYLNMQKIVSTFIEILLGLSTFHYLKLSFIFYSCRKKTSVYIKALVGALIRFVGEKTASVFLIQNSLGNEGVKEVDINV
jgi:hypothetical protein